MSNPDPNALAVLGFDPTSIAALRMLPMDERVIRLRALKLEARRRYRKKAAEIHPDRHGNDPEKTAELVRLNEAFQAIKEVDAAAFTPAVPRRPPVRFVQFHQGIGFSNSSSTTSVGWGGVSIRIVIS